jgi:hypothetical protein
MAKKKEMNRTSGTAKRKISQAEEVRFGMKTGKPLTGSASGVKSISLKQAGEALTQGIVTTRGGKLQFAPEGLAMALPTGKVAKAAGLLLGKGKIFPATGLVKRLTAKDYGRSAAKEIARNAKTPNMAQQAAQDSYERVADLTRSGRSARGKSELVFPRAPKKGALGDLEAGALPGSNMTNVQARRLAASRAADRAGNYTPVRELENRLSLPDASKGAYKAVKFGPNPAYKSGAKEIARSKMASKETKAALNKRLNKTFDLPGFDFSPIFKKTRGK